MIDLSDSLMLLLFIAGGLAGCFVYRVWLDIMVRKSCATGINAALAATIVCFIIAMVFFLIIINLM